MVPIYDGGTVPIPGYGYHSKLLGTFHSQGGWDGYSFRILSVLSDFHNPACTNRFLAGYFLIERGNPTKHTWNRGTAINGMVVLDGIKRLVSLVLIVMSST